MQKFDLYPTFCTGAQEDIHSALSSFSTQQEPYEIGWTEKQQNGPKLSSKILWIRVD